jgi:hypothetical protein
MKEYRVAVKICSEEPITRIVFVRTETGDDARRIAHDDLERGSGYPCLVTGCSEVFDLPNGEIIRGSARLSIGDIGAR